MYQRIVEIPRKSKTLVVLSLDVIAILAAALLAVSLRISDLWPAAVVERSLPFIAVMIGLGIPVAFLMGLPRIKLSVFDMQSTVTIGLFAGVMGGLGTALNILFDLGAPRTVPMIMGFLVFCLSVGWKLAASTLLDRLRSGAGSQIPIAIYGAGSAGIQLISTLQRSGEFKVMALVDDNPSLHGITIGGYTVQSPAILRRLAISGRIERVVLAMPSVHRARQREIVDELEKQHIRAQTVPSYAEMLRDGTFGQGMRPVDPNELLSRDKVDLDLPGMAEAYQGKSVLVSGAGGSIGSELCRQILSARPGKLVLLDHSEYALYEIERELAPLAAKAGVEILPVLGSVTDARRVSRTIARHGTQIILHAAAYKHVPMVEANILEGVFNNVFGTQTIAQCARDAGIEKFILISTDKAVRPTNVMGATKRLAEMVVQDLSRRAGPTSFAMVRFGNVLGSSGSVIPLFQSQIAAGGPVTVTHPDVTRFFMTVPEASRLVLLAGSYARGGDVFVLDMGEPVKIMELARRMIAMSGVSVQDEDNPQGDIRIEVTGLRPGEKLYEELLIGDGDLLETPHPKILRAEERCPSEQDVAGLIEQLKNAQANDDVDTALNVVRRWVEGYQPGQSKLALAAE